MDMALDGPRDGVAAVGRANAGVAVREAGSFPAAGALRRDLAGQAAATDSSLCLNAGVS